jgi:hypothetical protein
MGVNWDGFVAAIFFIFIICFLASPWVIKLWDIYFKFVCGILA